MKVLMPQLGETVLEGTITAWHKQVGDEVEKDETLLDVETDKAAMEIPSPIAGTLTAIRVAEGETVEVGTVLALIGDDDEEEEAPTDAPAEADQPANKHPARAARPGARGDGGERLSPVVRRLIAEHGLDASRISGTGPNGRISRQDVLAFIESAGSATPEGVTPEDGERIPFNRVRRLTAEHMVRSKATSPHVLQAIEVDFSAVATARATLGEAWKKSRGYSLSYQAFVARAVCEALADFPRLNASVDGEALVVHEKINLAIAIDLNFEGLVAPVIPDAARLTVAGLAEAIHDLVERARGKKLSPDDFLNGTYTLSNPGPFGTLFTAPIINQPQVGILSMDAIQKRAMVVESEKGDSIEARPVGILAQSFDHRAVDGAYSAAFLNKLKSLIEKTDWAQAVGG